jgi:uncharacterized protein (DUF1697 family)
MSRFLALLRGVNVGGKNALPMKDLAAMFVDSGCTQVKTYIQSGNVVFRAGSRVASKISVTIANQIADRFGLIVPVVVRTDAELRDVIQNNPFLKAGEREDTMHVYFLADSPNAELVSKLDPKRSDIDRFSVRNREIYLHLPNGMGRSKLTNAYFDSKLKTVSTARNWRTVLKLYEMLQE